MPDDSPNPVPIDIAGLCAHVIARRPLLLALLLGLLVALSVFVVGNAPRFDSDILNLLPADNPAVIGLKRYNEQFTQTRELAFLLRAPEAEAAAEAHAEFVVRLEREPWATRVLAGSPVLERGFPEPPVVARLMLSLPEEDFTRALEQLEPDVLARRIDALAMRAAAGSPSALTELQADPLGIAGLAVARVVQSVDIEGNFELESPEGTAFVIPVVTNQSDASAESCAETMASVRAFLDEVVPELGEGVTVGVTGRSAYVQEIAASMEADLKRTTLVSGLSVLFLFWLGFRRLLPLVGIGILLSAAALATLAGGMLALGELNLIAISFCSILFGLGDDFSLLLCQRFYRARAERVPREASIARALREAMPGIFWVALTTAVGFLALCLSGSSGMGQLGALVALGVVLCALVMPVFLFLFLGNKVSGLQAATGPLAPWIDWCGRSSKAMAWIVGVLGLAVAVTALAPWRAMQFDLSPSSLEPRETPAAVVLAEMLALFPGTFEPVMVLVENPDATSLKNLDESLASLAACGMATKISSPSGLWLDSARAEANATRFRDFESAPVLREVAAAMHRNGLREETFAPALETLALLAEPETPAWGWSDVLPQDSPWWFLVDRMLAPGGSAAIAYFKAPDGLSSGERLTFAREIMDAVHGSTVTGWTQALSSLVPWAQGELAMFGSAVVAIVLGILAFVYRDARLWIVHVAALAFGLAGTVATLKFLDAKINLLNVLAFPLILAVGVDYGTHILLAAREHGRSMVALAGVVKAVALSGLTTAAGFGALLLARNPSLSGLGLILSTGVLWSLASTLLVATPFAARLLRK